MKEAAALGTAIAAGVGAGIYASMEETAEEFVQWEQTFEPVTENHELYKEFYKTWKTVYDSQLTLADNGSPHICGLRLVHCNTLHKGVNCMLKSE